MHPLYYGFAVEFGQKFIMTADVIIRAFSEDSVKRLTGLTTSQLRYWDRTEFFAPEYADPNRKAAYSRLYSFRDIVALRTLSVLRNQYSVPLQHLRKVAQKLSHLGYDLWTNTTLYVLNRKVIFHEPGTDVPQEVVSGQYVIGLLLKTIISDTTKDVEKMRRRDPNKIGQIERSRYVNRNAWVVGGTRIPTAAIRRFKEAGYTEEQIMSEYPDLTLRDIKAALVHEQKQVSAA
jgi:DNA-binding transcriptional MerR regulator